MNNIRSSMRKRELKGFAHAVRHNKMAFTGCITLLIFLIIEKISTQIFGDGSVYKPTFRKKC